MPVRWLALSLFLSAAIAVPVSATTMVASPLEKLVAGSERVVHATTIGTRAEWDAHRRILTIATVRVLDAWVGDAGAGSELEVVSFGGVRDGIAMMVPGAPRFEEGEEVVLFLGRAPDGSLAVVDMAQGKFEVQRSPAGEARLERSGLAEVHWVGEPAGPAPTLLDLRARVGEISRQQQATSRVRGGAR